jgi:hypothetical protein
MSVSGGEKTIHPLSLEELCWDRVSQNVQIAGDPTPREGAVCAAEGEESLPVWTCQ